MRILRFRALFVEEGEGCYPLHWTVEPLVSPKRIGMDRLFISDGSKRIACFVSKFLRLCRLWTNNVQYTPPTPTRLSSWVVSRGRCALTRRQSWLSFQYSTARLRIHLKFSTCSVLNLSTKSVVWVANSMHTADATRLSGVGGVYRAQPARKPILSVPRRLKSRNKMASTSGPMISLSTAGKASLPHYLIHHQWQGT